MIIYFLLISLASIYCYLTSNSIFEGFNSNMCNNYQNGQYVETPEEKKERKKGEEACKESSKCKKKKFKAEKIPSNANKYFKNFRNILKKTITGITLFFIELFRTTFLTPLLLIDIVIVTIIYIWNLFNLKLKILLISIISPILFILFALFVKKDEYGNKIKSILSFNGFITRLNTAIYYAKHHPAFPFYAALFAAYCIYRIFMLFLNKLMPSLYKIVKKILTLGTIEDTKKRWLAVLNAFPNQKNFERLNPVFVVLDSRCGTKTAQCNKWMDKKNYNDAIREQNRAACELASRTGEVTKEKQEEYSDASGILGILVIIIASITGGYIINRRLEGNSIVGSKLPVNVPTRG